MGRSPRELLGLTTCYLWANWFKVIPWSAPSLLIIHRTPEMLRQVMRILKPVTVDVAISLWIAIAFVLARIRLPTRICP